MKSLLRLLGKAGFGIDDRAAGPGGTPLQVGALPYRVDDAGALEVLLITSRNSGRWIVPKGWPVRGLSFAESAAREAIEEAGVRGKVGDGEIGRLITSKRAATSGTARMLPIAIFPLRAEQSLPRWREMAERRRLWMPRAEAAGAVDMPELAALISTFEPRAR